jgi:hypothetical protein
VSWPALSTLLSREKSSGSCEPPRIQQKDLHEILIWDDPIVGSASPAPWSSRRGACPNPPNSEPGLTPRRDRVATRVVGRGTLRLPSAGETTFRWDAMIASRCRRSPHPPRRCGAPMLPHLAQGANQEAPDAVSPEEIRDGVISLVDVETKEAACQGVPKRSRRGVGRLRLSGNFDEGCIDGAPSPPRRRRRTFDLADRPLAGLQTGRRRLRAAATH